MTQCDAIAKHSKERCKQPACQGSTKCRYHGGKSLRGAAHPNFKDGSYVKKSMPTQLAAKYEASLNDPDLMNIRWIAALRSAFIQERLEALSLGGDLANILENLNANYQDMRTAYYAANSSGMHAALERYRLIIDDGQRYNAMRNEIEAALNDQRKDITDYEAIIHRGENAIPFEQVVTLLAAFSAFIMKEFADDTKRMNRALNYVDSLLIRAD